MSQQIQVRALDLLTM